MSATFSNPTCGPEPLRESILRYVRYTLARPDMPFLPQELFKPLSLAIRDVLVDRLLETEQRYSTQDVKRVYYLSMEFLMGRWLSDNLCNLGLNNECRAVLAELGIDLQDVLEVESDAGLGNGGLGRLAACFLESMATLGMPGFGYGIDYEFGLFKQEIFNGFQREKPDRWKVNGTPFEIEHLEDAVNVPIYGRVEGPRELEHTSEQVWTGQKIVLGI